MSLSAKSNAIAKRCCKQIAVRKKNQHESLKAGLSDWGFEFQGGKLWDMEDSMQTTDDLWASDKLRFWEIDEIEKGIEDADFEQMLEGKSSGARYLARRLRQSSWQVYKPTITEILSDWAAIKELRHWMYLQDAEYLKRMDLDSAGKLLHLGIRFAWQAERFCQLYSEVCVENRPWGSCYQPSHGKVKALALTPNYNRLPLWVKKILVTTPQWVETNEVTDSRPEGGRIGNVWRLIDCAKAWKHAPYLPKGIAEKVGQMSLESRMLAAWAWEKACDKADISSAYTLSDLRWRWPAI